MISIVQLGTIDYPAGLELQRTLVELRHSGKIPNVLLLLEHTPVITLGRNANRRNVLAPPAVLERMGVKVFECDRGGDVTYHGPGQLVGYPIFDLRSFPSLSPTASAEGFQVEHRGTESGKRTMGAVDYVRCLEEVLIRSCADFGVSAERVAKLTGVWTKPSSGPPAVFGEGQDQPAAQAKIAAIGVHISRGITSHGFAFNINTNLSHFDLIVPCGITTKPVTSLSKKTGALVSLDTVAQSVARNFGRVFNSQILWVETLDALLGRTVGVPMKVPDKLRKIHEEDIFQA
jgi:lipoyl(octanoyl) transferase